MTNKRTHILLGVSIASTLVAGGLIFFAFSTINKKNAEAVVLSQKIQEKLTEQENLTKFKNVIKETNQKHEILKSYVVDQNRVDELVTYLEAIGDNVGIAIEIKNVEIPIAKPNTVLVAFDGVGTFGSLMNLVWIIENLPYNVDINSFAISSDSIGGWKMNIKLEFISNQILKPNENPGL